MQRITYLTKLYKCLTEKRLVGIKKKKKINLSTRYKRQEVLMSYNRPRPERTRHRSSQLKRLTAGSHRLQLSCTNTTSNKIITFYKKKNIRDKFCIHFEKTGITFQTTNYFASIKKMSTTDFATFNFNCPSKIKLVKYNNIVLATKYILGKNNVLSEIMKLSIRFMRLNVKHSALCKLINVFLITFVIRNNRQIFALKCAPTASDADRKNYSRKKSCEVYLDMFVLLPVFLFRHHLPILHQRQQIRIYKMPSSLKRNSEGIIY